jgi:hypothetical protein
MLTKTIFGTLAAILAAGTPAPTGQQSSAPSPPVPTEVLVLGTYHMANPGHDIFNMKADDVLAPKRQAEIAEVVAVLKKFQPTKIAVEADVYRDTTQKAYADYLAGRHELTRNEIEQLGFRLARELGHKTVYSVDADGDFPWQRLVNYARGTGGGKELEALMGEIGGMVRAQGEFLASHRILEALLDLNSDERVARDVGFYYREAHWGEPGDWSGADLIAEWVRRNMRIFTNITRLAEPSREERILVIYGSGHLGWLRAAVASDPTLRLRKLAEFAR